MIVQLIGTGTHNKGAELMAHAVSKWASTFDNVVPCVTPDFGPYLQRAKAGLHSLIYPTVFSRKGIVALFASDYFMDTFGVVKDSQVSAILDASGFAYGDQWGVGPARRLLNLARDSRGSKKKLILLPQAFGPFTNPRIAENLKKSANGIDLIFARDQRSYEALKEIDLQTRIEIAPDFTVGVSGVVPKNSGVNNSTALIVPNERMLDKGSETDRRNYLQFLVRCIGFLKRRSLTPVVLSHSSDDSKLSKQLIDNLGGAVKVITEEDPILIKGLLGTPSVIVGSRYHALISGLLQGVPCIGSGWSFKYEELFNDFGIPDLLLECDSSDSVIEAAVDQVVDVDSRERILESMSACRNRYEMQTELMWDKVNSVLGLSKTPC